MGWGEAWKGRGEKKGKKKTPPARLALVQKALQLTHLVLIFQTYLVILRLSEDKFIIQKKHKQFEK